MEGKRCTPIRALCFQPTGTTEPYKSTQKQYLAFVKECSCAHQRAAHKTSGKLELACRPALQSRVSTVLAAFALYCDSLGSPFRCRLVDLAQPVKHDTRMDANSDFCREASFVASVEPTTAVLGQSSRHPVMVVSVTGVSLEEGPPLEKHSRRCMWQYNEGVILL